MWIKNNKWLITTTILILVRIGLAMLPSFRVDMDAWLAWAWRLAEGGTANFYSDAVWTQYTPGFLYWLWMMGKLGYVTPIMIKLPVILADLATAWMITRIVKGREKLQWWLYVGYILSPVVLWDGAVWGQIDGILTMFMLASYYLLIERNNWWLSWISISIALLIKPQAIAVVPVLLLATIIRAGWPKLLIGVSLAGTMQLLGYFPFFPENAWKGMIELWQKMSVSYPYTSLFAFNIWGWVGMWQSDAITWLGKTYAQWGVIMSGSVMMGALLATWKSIQSNKWIVYWLAMMACWIFFLFPTRVHDRYLFPMFAFAYIVVGWTKSKIAYYWIIFTTIIYTINLYLPYGYYESTSNWLVNPELVRLIESASFYWITLIFLAWIGWVMIGLFPAGKNIKVVRPKIGR